MIDYLTVSFLTATFAVLALCPWTLPGRRFESQGLSDVISGRLSQKRRCDKRSFSSHHDGKNDIFRLESQSKGLYQTMHKPHKVNYLNGFDKKRVVSQYVTKYVTLLSLSPHNNGLQIPVGHFLCNFVAPLSHQMYILSFQIVFKYKVSKLCFSWCLVIFVI